METAYTSPREKNRFFRYRYNSTAALTLGLLLFMLPFARIKCGTVTMAENTGIRMATGQQWKVSLGGFEKELLGDMNKVTGSSANKGKMQWFIGLAGMFGFFGLMVSFGHRDTRAIVTMVASILASAMLIGSYFDLKMQLRSMPFDDAYESAGIGGTGFIKLKFSIWYFISLLSFIAAAIFSYMHHRIELADRQAETMMFDFQLEKEIPPAAE